MSHRSPLDERRYLLAIANPRIPHKVLALQSGTSVAAFRKSIDRYCRETGARRPKRALARDPSPSEVHRYKLATADPHATYAELAARDGVPLRTFMRCIEAYCRKTGKKRPRLPRAASIRPRVEAALDALPPGEGPDAGEIAHDLGLTVRQVDDAMRNLVRTKRWRWHKPVIGRSPSEAKIWELAAKIRAGREAS